MHMINSKYNLFMGGRAGAKPGGAGLGGVPFAVGVGSWRVWGRAWPRQIHSVPHL